MAGIIGLLFPAAWNSLFKGTYIKPAPFSFPEKFFHGVQGLWGLVRTRVSWYCVFFGRSMKGYGM